MPQMLPLLPPNFARMPDRDELLQRYWQELVTLLGEVPAIQESLAGLDTAVADAQAAADTAQAAADAAQATADSIVVPPTGVLSVSADTVLTPNDVTILVDTTGGSVTITLSAAFGYSVPVVITKTDSSGNTVDVQRGGSDTLNGGTLPVSLTLPNEARTFTSDQETGWYG